MLSIIVPYRPEPNREELWQTTREHLAKAFPDAELVVSGDRGDDPALFNHGQAINMAARRATGDVLLIADADTIPDPPASLKDAVAATTEDRLWRLPSDYYMLTEQATRCIVAGGVWPVDSYYEWHGRNRSWSGLVIVPIEAFMLVGGYEERFVGWGADDAAMALALTTLWGPVVRYEGAALHLWHGRDDQNRGWYDAAPDGNRLVTRYEQAAGNRDEMRALIGERA